MRDKTRWFNLYDAIVRLRTSSYTSKHGNDGSSQPVSSDTFGQVEPITGFGVVDSKDQHGGVEHEKTGRTKSESHDGTGAKRGVEAGSPAGLLCRHRGAHVAVDRHFHSQVSASHGSNGTEQERKSREESTSRIPSGTPGYEYEDDDTENGNEPETDGVLGAEKALGALVDGFVNFLETRRLFTVRCRTGERLRFAAIVTSRLDRNLGNDSELDVGPDQAYGCGAKDDCSCIELLTRRCEKATLERRDSSSLV